MSYSIRFLAGSLLVTVLIIFAGDVRPIPILSSSSSSCAAPMQPHATQNSSTGGDTLIYADFENPQNNRPVSKRGGLVQMISSQEVETRPSRYKSIPNSSPPAPELVRLKPDDPNRAIAFEYELQAPNQYAAVGVEIFGQPHKDGKPVSDDVSVYKSLTVQVYATGVPAVRIEFMSHGNGLEIPYGYPQMSFKVKPGFNTYKIQLSSLAQPSWVQQKLNTKDVLKKLTSISLSAYCDQCTPIKGTVVIDNLIFQK